MEGKPLDSVYIFLGMFKIELQKLKEKIKNGGICDYFTDTPLINFNDLFEQPFNRLFAQHIF